MNALKLAGIVSQSINDVKLNIGESKKNLEVLSTEKSLGKTKTLLPAKITGEPLEIYFNWKYLFDGLKTFKEKEVTLGLNGHDKPALIKSKDTSFLYVLMPIRQ